MIFILTILKQFKSMGLIQIQDDLGQKYSFRPTQSTDKRKVYYCNFTSTNKNCFVKKKIRCTGRIILVGNEIKKFSHNIHDERDMRVANK